MYIFQMNINSFTYDCVFNLIYFYFSKLKIKISLLDMNIFLSQSDNKTTEKIFHIHQHILFHHFHFPYKRWLYLCGKSTSERKHKYKCQNNHFPYSYLPAMNPRLMHKYLYWRHWITQLPSSSMAHGIHLLFHFSLPLIAQHPKLCPNTLRLAIGKE